MSDCRNSTVVPRQNCESGTDLNGWGRRMPKGFLPYLQVGNLLQAKGQIFPGAGADIPKTLPG